MSSKHDAAIKVSEDILKPGPIGRALRSITGIGQAYFIVSVVPHYAYFMSDSLPGDPMYWIAVIAGFLVLNPVIHIGFNIQWPRSPQRVFLLLLVIAIGFDLWQYGKVWGPPLNFLIFLMAVYVHTHLGVAHILSGILGTPGCEMRAIPQLWAMLTKSETEAHICPAFWSRFDRWETNFKNEKAKQ